jgi:enoyl-CoA hydratase/carnithine racemase
MTDAAGGNPPAVLVERGDDGVVVMTFNRPERRNALTADAYHQLAAALEEATGDEKTSVVVLTGAGAGFCAGVDLEAYKSGDRDALAEGFDRLMAALMRFPKPLIAAVHGAAVGLGTTLLLHADLVVADETARFRTPFPQMHLVPEAGSSVTLPARIGRADAAWMLLSGEWVSAGEATDQGLVWRLTPEGEAREEALAAARQLAALPLDSLVATKRLLDHGRAEQIEAALRRERDEMAALTGRPGG